MKRFALLLVLAGAMTTFSVTAASADQGTSGHNPKVQFRTFTCDNHQTYTGGFVGPHAANFFISGTTSTFAIKSFTVLTSPSQTFETGIQGYPGPLITCWYTDPQGISNVFSGFITPNS
jgi:hypothetical protein